MTPILYAEDETAFTTLGLGYLTETTSCKVTEERNGAFELVLKYDIKGARYKDIKLSRIILAQPAYKKTLQAFRIYRITKPLNRIVTIYAEHISYQLSAIPVMPFTATGAADAISKIKNQSAETNPFDFYTDITNTTSVMSPKVPASARALLGGTQGSMIDTYGGELEFDNYTVKLLRSRGQNRGVEIRYGKNLTDLKQEENISNTITGICPFWSDTDGNVVTIAEKVVHAQSAALFPYQRTIVKDFSMDFDEKPTPAQLKAKAEAYVAKSGIGVPEVSMDVSFVALQDMEGYEGKPLLEAVNLCDTVKVVFEELNVETTAKVVKTVWDVLAEQYEKISIGTVRGSITTALQETEEEIKTQAAETKTTLERAVTRATDQITGVNGGHVVINRNANGEPFEILIMDADTIDSATKVWRWNQNGLGYSKNGYDGDYETAMTQNGEIVADFITAGTIEGIVIKGTRFEGNTGEIGGWRIYNNYLENRSKPWASDNKIRKAYLQEPTGPDNWVFSVQEAVEEGENPASYRSLYLVRGDGDTIWGDGAGRQFLQILPKQSSIFVKDAQNQNIFWITQDTVHAKSLGSETVSATKMSATEKIETAELAADSPIIQKNDYTAAKTCVGSNLNITMELTGKKVEIYSHTKAQSGGVTTRKVGEFTLT